MKPQTQPAAPHADFARNAAGSRYELRIDGELAAQADYREAAGALRFTHTETRPEFRGQGLASRLAAFALDDVRTRGLKVVAQCNFIRKYIEANQPAYADLVAP